MKLLVSACLLGIACKYSGGDNLDPALLQALHNAGHELVLLSCPETISEGKCARFQAYLKETVMKNAF